MQQQFDLVGEKNQHDANTFWKVSILTRLIGMKAENIQYKGVARLLSGHNKKSELAVCYKYGTGIETVQKIVSECPMMVATL